MSCRITLSARASASLFEQTMNNIIRTDDFKQRHPDSWFSSVLASISGVNLRHRIMRNTAASFHVHEVNSECFFVLTGTVKIETEQGQIVLNSGDFYEIKPGVKHRAIVEGEATMLVLDSLQP
jgi:mannose-6-phosphate isomerase-like protein (cupin superfamily)